SYLVIMLPAAAGDTASAVLKPPYATHGCRPVSVTIQPQITATNPIHQACCAGHKYQRALNKRPRHHNHAPPVIGRSVADHDVLVGRNRYPDVDTIDGTVAVLRTRRDDGNTTPGNAVLVFLQPLHLMSNCCADGL